MGSDPIITAWIAGLGAGTGAAFTGVGRAGDGILPERTGAGLVGGAGFFAAAWRTAFFGTIATFFTTGFDLAAGLADPRTGFFFLAGDGFRAVRLGAFARVPALRDFVPRALA